MTALSLHKDPTHGCQPYLFTQTPHTVALSLWNQPCSSISFISPHNTLPPLTSALSCELFAPPYRVCDNCAVGCRRAPPIVANAIEASYWYVGSGNAMRGATTTIMNSASRDDGTSRCCNHGRHMLEPADGGVACGGARAGTGRRRS